MWLFLGDYYPFAVFKRLLCCSCLDNYYSVAVFGRLLSCGCLWEIIMIWLSLGDFYQVAVFGRLLSFGCLLNIIILRLYVCRAVLQYYPEIKTVIS